MTAWRRASRFHHRLLYARLGAICHGRIQLQAAFDAGMTPTIREELCQVRDRRMWTYPGQIAVKRLTEFEAAHGDIGGQDGEVWHSNM